MKNKQTILYVSLAITVLTAVYFITKTVRTQNQLQQSITAQTQLEDRVAVQDAILEADSLLVRGQYNQALEVYDEQLSNKAQFNKELQLKIALTHKLQEMGTHLTSSKARDTTAVKDTLSASLAKSSAAFTRKIDSISFALKKARVELNSMRKRLNQKSIGAYLTFKSKKGNHIHYVGSVTNQKANGYGIALLDSGSRYEGEWKDNQRHGEGVFYWKDGEYYEGSYQNDQRSGAGSYYWPNGDKYVGHWKNDKRNGQGSFYGKKGPVVTKGIWKNDKLVTQEK